MSGPLVWPLTTTVAVIKLRLYGRQAGRRQSRPISLIDPARARRHAHRHARKSANMHTTCVRACVRDAYSRTHMPYAHTHSRNARVHVPHQLKHTHAHARTNARTHERTNERTNARTRARTNARTHGRTNARTHERTKAQTHARTHVQTRARAHEHARVRAHAHIRAQNSHTDTCLNIVDKHLCGGVTFRCCFLLVIGWHRITAVHVCLGSMLGT